MERWKNKIAVVTGSSSGIGAAVASALVTSGVKVVGLARRKQRVEELALKLSDAEGQLYAYQADMSKEEDILAAFKWIKNNLGPVSILVNNAGVLKPTNFTNGNTEMWKEVLDTSVLGLCIATREAIRDMKVNNINGHIIHMNSVFGHILPPIPHFNMYPVAKFAMTALTEILRQELNTIGSKIKISFPLLSVSMMNALLLGSGSIFLQLVTAYWGHQVIIQSEAVAYACLEEDFVSADVRCQRSLLLVMQRSHTPTSFTVGKFAPLSLQTFLMVMKTSYSYFMFLHHQTSRRLST